MHISLTIQRLAVGYLLGAIPALLVGWAIGRRRWLDVGCSPLLVVLGAFPALALYPIIMLVFGLGEPSKWVVVALSVCFPVFYWTKLSAASGSNNSQDATRTLESRGAGLSRALPLVFIGLKLAGGVALLALMPAEFVGAKTGIGYLIWNSWMYFHVDPMYVGIAFAGLVGSGAWLVLTALEWLLRQALTPAPGQVLRGEQGSE
jgi:NitT/TauT family transport system permease protein